MVMKALRILAAVALVASVGLSSTLVSSARAETGPSAVQVSVLGGVQALNQNDTALPDKFVNIPAAAAVAYQFNPVWGAEGEVSWMIPVKRSVDLGIGGKTDRKTPDILTYQANVVGRLPLSGTPWSPYLTGGLGAITFLSNTDADRYPQLSKTQTTFGINFGAGTSYSLGPHWGVRGDFRELAAFPSKDTDGLGNGSKADPIWMERGAIGLGYRF